MSCRLLCVFALATLVGLPALIDAAGAACVAYTDYIQPLDVHYPAGYVRSMAYQAPYVYTAGDSRMLTVLDSSDPTDLVEAGTLRPAFRGALGHACLRAGLGLHAEQPRCLCGGSE